jgi:transposase
MRPQRQIDDKAKQTLRRLLTEVTDKGDFQRVQCVWFRAVMGLNHKQVAPLIGWSESRVKQVWSNYFKHGEEVLIGIGRGGRHRENLSVEEEKLFLKDFAATASSGEMLIVDQVHAAYERMIGHSVPKSTVYRMLDRQGWRKIVPRPRHPKNDPLQAEEFKKNSVSSSQRKVKGRRDQGGNSV